MSCDKDARQWLKHKRSVGWTQAAGECFSLLLECSHHFLMCFIIEQSTVLAFFYLFYNIALLTCVKKLALICKKTNFITSLQACTRKVTPCICTLIKHDVSTNQSVHWNFIIKNVLNLLLQYLLWSKKILASSINVNLKLLAQKYLPNANFVY